ncbi:MAG: alkaline phosphatase [Melioribacteraceae bacterium]|nr:alkaline phosphatase [Melioribacteraceae bacterium]
MKKIKQQIKNDKEFMKVFKVFFWGLILFLVSSSFSKDNITPKNIIIFLGDGMGYNHIDIASYYQFGETGKQVYEKFPVKLGMSSHMIGGVVYNPDSAWTNFNYVKKRPTDSAASGTALATGTKTYYTAISVDSSKTKLLTILERAKMIGKSTGVVSTVPFSNATPAVFVAHNESRYNYREIAEEMILESKVDVIMGGGNPLFNHDGTSIKSERTIGAKESYDIVDGDTSIITDIEETFKYVGGKEVWNLLIEGKAGGDADDDGIDDPWKLIQKRDMFKKYISGETPRRVIGVFESRQASQIEREDSLDNGEPFSAPLNENIPTLDEMTLAAINIIDDNPNGFVLVSEGGAIDWAAHSNLLHRTIEEQIEFNKTIEAVCNWVETNSSWDETLIVITADHETGYLVGPGSNREGAETISEIWKPIINNGKGKLPTVEWFTKGHTNVLVPFYAKGVGSEIFRNYIKGNDKVRGEYIDNSDVGNVISNFLKK